MQSRCSSPPALKICSWFFPPHNSREDNGVCSLFEDFKRRLKEGSWLLREGSVSRKMRRWRFQDERRLKAETLVEREREQLERVGGNAIRKVWVVHDLALWTMGVREYVKVLCVTYSGVNYFGFTIKALAWRMDLALPQLLVVCLLLG